LAFAAAFAVANSLVALATASCAAVANALIEDSVASSSAWTALISSNSSSEQLGVVSSKIAVAKAAPSVMPSSVFNENAVFISAVMLINSAHVSGFVIFPKDLRFLPLLLADKLESKALTFAAC